MDTCEVGFQNTQRLIEVYYITCLMYWGEYVAVMIRRNFDF